MKTCDQAAELLPALAETLLGADQANEVRAHLSTCAECAESWKTQELISRHFRETDPAGGRPDYFWTKQRRHILEEVGLGTSRFEQAAPPRRGVLRFALVAAAAALLVVGAFALLKPNTAPSTPDAMADKPKEPKDTPVVLNPPKEAPQTPPETPKEEFVDKPPATKEETNPPAQDQVVEGPNPAPDPQKEKSKPDKGVVKKPESKPDDTTPKTPSKETPAAPKDVLAILPGHPKYPARLAQEQAEILIPVTADLKSPLVKDLATPEQALAFLKSARARLDDMQAMHARDPKSDLTEMVDAYAVLVGEGASRVLYVIASGGGSAPGARTELRAHQAAFAKFPEPLQKGALAPAIKACAAAVDLKPRLHNHATRGSESGALVSARESVGLLEGSVNVVARARRGFAIARRYVGSILGHAKLGRLPNAEGELEAYQKLVEAVVGMLEWLETKDQEGTCSRAKVDLLDFMAGFKKFAGPEPLKGLMKAAFDWTSDMHIHVSRMEAFYQGKLPKPPKRDPAPPPQSPPQSPPAAPPPAPPFGEKGEDPPPPPPPKGFDEPK